VARRQPGRRAREARVLVDRRTFVSWVVLGALAAPHLVLAQADRKVARIAFISTAAGALPDSWWGAFVASLGAQGWREHQNLVIERRYVEPRTDAALAAAEELVRLKVDVIVVSSTLTALAAKQATTTIPIVVGASSNLVAQGLAAGLAQPGGNLTGFELRDIELTGKRLELLKAAVPTIARVAVLANPTIRAHDDVPSTLAPDARTLGVQLQRVAADTPEAFEGAFTAMVQGRAEALMIMDVPVFARNRHRLLELARLHRLPTISGTRFFAEAGSLLAYGANVYDLCRRSAVYVDKILKGTKPADLPVEQPTKFEFVINLKAAKQIGLTIPPNVLARADKVIR